MNCNRECIKKSLQELYQKFIVTPIDKANRNVAVICKSILCFDTTKELGLEENHASDSRMSANYEDKATHQWINSHTDAILKHFNISLNPENKCLPLI